jgi:hypothetical protein
MRTQVIKVYYYITDIWFNKLNIYNNNNNRCQLFMFLLGSEIYHFINFKCINLIIIKYKVNTEISHYFRYIL